MTLAAKWEIIYYNSAGDRKIYWPACRDAELLKCKLREARERGLAVRLATA